MTYYMRVAAGVPVGYPMTKPALVEIDDGHGGIARVGCAHWSHTELAEISSLVRCLPGYNPDWHIATGGGIIGADGLVAPAYQDRPLADLVARAISRIDAEAEAIRLRYLTPGAGQAQTYEAKRTEAERGAIAMLLGQSLSPADYPWASARAVRLGIDVADVIDDWHHRSKAWVSIGISIETVREGAKEAVITATSAAAIKAVIDDLAWPG